MKLEPPLGKLAVELHGSGDAGSRRNVSSDLSRLNSLGLVESPKRGESQITDKGRADLNGGQR